MKKFFLSLIFYLFCFPILGFFGGEENMKEICTTDIDGKDRNPPMVTNQACFDNFSCPLISDMKKNHYLLLVDTTDGLSKNEIGFLKGDVLDPKTLTQEIEPFSKVSVINLNDKFSPSEVKPETALCRPRSGNSVSPFAADAPHSSEGIRITKRKFNDWGFVTSNKTIERLADSTPAKRTLLFEHINSVTTISKFDFRETDYKNRILILFSDLLHFSERINLRRSCKDFDVNRNCSNFEKFYKSSSQKVRTYIDRIKPSFSENTKIIIYHVINQEVKGRPLEKNLKGLWMSFFEWAGVKKENIDYRMLFDSV